MIPLKDDIPSNRRPYITYIILACNIIVFIYELTLGKNLDNFFFAYGAVPSSLISGHNPLAVLTLFSSMFMHANFAHIIGNMLFLWIFADNIEDRMGYFWFPIFYFFCGISGSLLHIVISPSSDIPMIGASGAISGVLGAYVLLFPKARVLALIPLGFFMRMTYLPSYIFLGIWFLYQFIFGVSSIGARGGGVAYFAHIGGFVAGFLIALLFRRKSYYKIV